MSMGANVGLSWKGGGAVVALLILGGLYIMSDVEIVGNTAVVGESGDDVTDDGGGLVDPVVLLAQARCAYVLTVDLLHVAAGACGAMVCCVGARA